MVFYREIKGFVLRLVVSCEGNGLLKHVIEGKMEGKTLWKIRRGRRRKQLPYGLRETKISWNSKGEALDHSLWRTRFGEAYWPVVRQTI
jgi:hypothetical protein